MTVTQASPELPSIDASELLKELALKPSPLMVIKPLLARIQAESHHYFRATLDATTLIHRRANIMDTLLQCLWQHLQLPQQGFALIAVGGYGRGQLHPHSDIDLLLLAQQEEQIHVSSDQLQSFITLLWDLKLDIGHSVRTLSECVQEAEKDLTVITNLMESRLLIGDTELHQQLLRHTAADKIWPTAQFFNAKWEEIQLRHRKHKDTEHNLEPCVKNSRGSLRDIQTISWVTMRHFGQGSLQALEDNGFLTHFEHQQLRKSEHFLWQVRYALHMLAGREEDRLLFDLQREIARLLGFEDDGNLLGVEQFMSRFYRKQLATMELCDLLLLHFHDDVMRADVRQVIEPLNQHFVFSDGYLKLLTHDLFAQDPSWLLRVFVMMAQYPSAKGIHANTIRALRDHRHLIDDQFRSNRQHNELFMQLMRNNSCVVRELSRMMRYGILGRYIPEFGSIIGMMEHDLYHVYTVNEHSMRMARLLRHFRFAELREQYPLASRLIHRVPKKEILYLTALLHDTGKSHEGDHCANSEEIAVQFCRQHNLRPTDSHLVAWLVANHLLMSNAAQRLDLNNPEDIHQFALEVGDQQHLDHLYLISVADVVTTNPKLWTPWRAEQMNDLYTNTLAALRRGLGNPMNKDDVIDEIQQEALEQLRLQGLTDEQILTIWGEPGDDYFLREGADNIIWHTLMIHAHGQNPAPLIALRQTSSHEFEGATQLFIFMKDQPNLFAITTATLDQLNINIQDARIMTSEKEHNAVDTYIILDEANRPIDDPKRIEHIRSTLETALSTPSQRPNIIQRRTPRALKQFPVATKVTISNDPLMLRTIVEVVAADRPGLLARVGAILSDFNAQLQGAKILTEGERVSDIFFIVDEDGNPFSDAQICQRLCTAITQGLDEQIEAQSAV
ncbi:MAG: [protein-PII] uridylyltransferase [Bacterioplanes sp.]|nr:[protein-PII] uridylyltransferase [Bacterioplanes sp.]